LRLLKAVMTLVHGIDIDFAKISQKFRLDARMVKCVCSLLFAP
jgi:hypothetical protein